MDWNTILSDVISGSIMLVVGGIGGWVAGRFKRKKESLLAIERKRELYQPLLDDIEKYSKFDWSIMEEIRTDFLKEIVNNPYKYGINRKLQDKCNCLYEMISEYNSIDIVKVAHNIIVDTFEKGYMEIYGSIIEGICCQCDRDGNEWEEEVIAEPVQTIRQIDNSKEIENLLINERMYSGEVCIDEKNRLFEPIYSELKQIYALALNVWVNGEQYTLPEPIIELKMLPEEYIAYKYDFFELYNGNKKIQRKCELHEEIIYMSRDIVENLRKIIDKIVRGYEVEEV